MFPSKQMTQALRNIRSRLGVDGYGRHIHEFVEGDDCPCGCSLDWVVEHRPTDPLVLELNPQ